MRYWLFLLLIPCFIGCYEPKEGCLDIDAVNYDASADDPCDACCKSPVLLFLMQHYVELATQPDTSFAMKYATKYPSPFDTSHYFYLDRGRFFISNLKLVRDNGEEVGVTDSLWLLLTNGDSLYVEDNFSKCDRDLFAADTIGKIKTLGVFTKLKFTLGLEEAVQKVYPDTLNNRHPLAVDTDSLSYEEGVGIFPYHLIIRPDTLPDTPPMIFKFDQARQISLDLPQPISVERGFSIRLTLRFEYLHLFKAVDFLHDTEAIIRSKIEDELEAGFSVVSVKLE